MVFKASFFIVFSWVQNNLSSLPKEEGEQLEETEDEEELEEEKESPPTDWQGQTEFTKDNYKIASAIFFLSGNLSNSKTDNMILNYTFAQQQPRLIILAIKQHMHLLACLI